MLVGNSNNLLNILLPNQENKAIKEVLKQADSKALENMTKNNASLNEVIKNLFDDIKTNNKSKQSIETLLKNSTIFKNLGNFSTNLKTLLDLLSLDKSLEKYTPSLKNFLLNIENLDENKLKELLGNSGVFLESKILNNANLKNTNLPLKLQELLVQIKNIIKDLPIEQTKQINNLLSKLLNSQNQSLQSMQTNTNDLINLLQNLVKNLSENKTQNLNFLLNQLKTLTQDAQLVESKIQNNLPIDTNNKQNILSQTKELLNNLKNEIILNKDVSSSKLLKQLDSLLNNKDLFSSNGKVEAKQLLNHLLNDENLKLESIKNPKVESLISKLSSISDEISNLEVKINSNEKTFLSKESLLNTLKENLSNLKNELILSNLKNPIINNIIEKLLNIQTLFDKIELPSTLKLEAQNTLLNFQSNFASNLNSLILSLKEQITNISQNPNANNIQNELLKIVDKIENVLKEGTLTNTNLLNEKNDKSFLQNDMKAILTLMQEELAKTNDSKANDSLKILDKLMLQMDYYQILSLTSNNTYVYLPFLWDMLEDGNISMKKLNEEKFYCEINLSLKDFGQTQLLLALYEKNKLDLTIYAQRDFFKNIVRKNITKLKQALNSVGLIPVDIKIIDMKDEKNSNQNEIKKTNIYEQNNSNIAFGIDIRA